jgi:hypothetical protein
MQRLARALTLRACLAASKLDIAVCIRRLMDLGSVDGKHLAWGYTERIVILLLEKETRLPRQVPGIYTASIPDLATECSKSSVGRV